MKVYLQSQKVSISNNYAAVASNCLGSGRPPGLEDKSPSARSRQPNGLQCYAQWVVIVGDIIQARYLGWDWPRKGELRVTGCLEVTEAATRSRTDVSTHSCRAFKSGAQFGKSFQGGGANVWGSFSSTLLTLAMVRCAAGEG